MVYLYYKVNGCFLSSFYDNFYQYFKRLYIWCLADGHDVCLCVPARRQVRTQTGASCPYITILFAFWAIIVILVLIKYNSGKILIGFQ
jgi:hypothetical protein